MQALWKLGPSFVKDLVPAMPKPRPAITTVSTIVRILEEKGFVDHEAFGRSHRYFAKVTREAYSGRSIKQLMRDYFGSSPEQLLSFFIEREDLDTKELDALLKMIQEKKER